MSKADARFIPRASFLRVLCACGVRLFPYSFSVSLRLRGELLPFVSFVSFVVKSFLPDLPVLPVILPLVSWRLGG
jgi:hypothetical protein